MARSKVDSAYRLASFLFEKVGLDSNYPFVFNAIEDVIGDSLSCERVDDDPTGFPQYESVIQENFVIVEDGVFSPPLSSKLTEDQKQLLLRLAREDSFELTVVRDDSSQLWQFCFHVPLTYNQLDSEVVELTIEVVLPAHSSGYELTASLLDEIDELVTSRLLAMYLLAL